MIFRLRFRQHDFELKRGPFVIGRSADSHLALDGPKVSRRHALLNVGVDQVVLEDLGSRNGVFVNGQLVEHVVGVRVGDVILIGDEELSLVASGGPDSTTVEQGVPVDRPGSMRLLAELADKAIALGRSEEAERLLSIHLLAVLDNAAEGQRVSGETADRAALYAARLASATRHGRWFNYPFQLCSELRRAFPAEAVDELYVAAPRVDSVELEVVVAYTERLRERGKALKPPERFLLSRLQGLERLLRLR